MKPTRHVSHTTRWIEKAIILCTILFVGIDFVRTLAPLIINGNLLGLIDFSAYYIAAKSLNAGSSLYDQQIFAEVAAQSGILKHTAYVYPPFFAVLLRPLALLPYESAGIIWLVCNGVFLIIAVWLLGKIYSLSLSAHFLVGLLLIIWYPTYYTLLLGQVDLLILCFLLGTIYLASLSRIQYQYIAGACIGLIATIKVVPACISIVFVLRKNIGILAATAITTIVLFTIGIVAGGGIANVYHWITRGVSMPIESGNQTYVLSNVSIYNSTKRLFEYQELHFLDSQNELHTTKIQPMIDSPFAGVVLGYIGAVIISIVSLYCLVVWTAQKKDTQSLVWDVGLMLTCLTLLLPVAWIHYYIWLIIPFAALVQKYSHSPSVLTLLVLIYLFVNLENNSTIPTPAGQIPLVLPTGFVANLSLWGMLVYSMLTERHTPTEQVADRPLQ